MSVPQKLVIATGNAGKLRELRNLLGAGFELLSQQELGLVPAHESGGSFLENALQKAHQAAAQSGLPAIGDDSGLEVDALDGAPGIFSARYAGANASDADNVAKLLAALSETDPEQRTARFRCVVAYVRGEQDRSPLISEGVWEGSIAMAPAGNAGFGYDPVFIDGATGRTAAQLDRADKNARSHRGMALRGLKAQLAGTDN